MSPPRQRDWRIALRRNPALSAWPFVVVILMQMAVGSISVYALSTIRAYVTNESQWIKAEHEAVYSLSRFFETRDARHLANYEQAIEVTLDYRKARDLLEQPHPDIAEVRRNLLKAGASGQDISGLIWMFRHARGFPYLERSITYWKDTDAPILELRRLGTEATAAKLSSSGGAQREILDQLDQLDAIIAPRAMAFTLALGEGSRFVERALIIANLGFATVLAALTIWRVSRTLSQRRQIEAALAWQASHDELTRLPNRRAFEERLAAVLKPAKSRVAHPVALLFIDLDQFKVVNDTCGHAAGDALLQRISDPLQQLLAPDAFLARFGGDEFSMLLPGTDAAEAFLVAERVRAEIERIDFGWNGKRFPITASIGLVHDRAGAISSELMLSRGDLACFMAKEKGRNRVHSHRQEDEELIGRVREMNWVQRIHQALDEDRFCLFAQEIVALKQGSEDGLHLEVLLRMRDEAGAIVPPSTFLPAAERYGLMHLIDRWVVRRTFRTLAERQRLDRPPITCCGINLSGATIGDKAFLSFLKGAFIDYGIAPQTICLEVTETSAILNLAAAKDFVRELGKLGCTFALDDFGAGMSSFSYLKELPVDFLKIDGSFVKNILNERADRAMVEMIGHVGHVMGKRIVAEFVGSDAMIDVLRDIGIDYGQGFAISPPQPFDADFGPETVRRMPLIEKHALIA